MPEYVGYNKTAKGTSKDPLSEFDSAGEFEKLNVEGASFDGQDDMGADREAGKALKEFAGLGGTRKNSSITSHGKTQIPSGGGPDSNVSK